MTNLFHPIRSLRDAFDQIGSAVNAAEEYSRSSARRAAQAPVRGRSAADWSGIPI